MLENEIKVVNEIINERKLCTISENRLIELCRKFDADSRIVLSVLNNKYNGIYEPSMDTHCCGCYRFDNPNLQKQDYFVLNYLFKDEDKYKPCGLLMIKADNDYYGRFGSEILRLEPKIKLPLEVIIKNLKEKNAFIGEDRIWFITTEKDY